MQKQLKRGRGRPKKEQPENLLAGLVDLEAQHEAEEEPQHHQEHSQQEAHYSPSFLSDQDLTMTTADLCQTTGYAHPAISNFVSTGLIKPQGRGLWPLFSTFKALFTKLKERAEKREKDSTTRRNQIDDDLQELKLLTAAKKVAPIAACKQYVSDSRIQVRQVIEHSTSLTSSQKNSLLLEISKLKELELELDDY